MKFLVYFSCALAFASAGYPYYASPYAQHVPIIDHNGVPLETPEVQAAKANHFAAHAAAKYGGYLAVGYTGHGVPAITADGQPIDTPEVQLARAAHFIAYNQAAIQNAYPHAAIAAGPIDTPEVQIAKAAHFEAHAEAKARGHYRRRRSPGYAYPGGPLPAIGNNGVPLDTPEVEAAKANHFAAHAQISSSRHSAPQAGPGPYPAYSGPSYNGFAGYHIPVIGANGVPTETPEVQAAKSNHFSALSKSAASGYQGGNHGGYQGGYQGAYQGPYAGPNYSNGAPQDTPEVQAARAAHLAAHASSGGQRYY